MADIDINPDSLIFEAPLWAGIKLSLLSELGTAPRNARAAWSSSCGTHLCLGVSVVTQRGAWWNFPSGLYFSAFARRKSMKRSLT